MKAANQPAPKEAHPENLGATASGIAQIREAAANLESGRAVLLHFHSSTRPAEAKKDEIYLTLRILVEKPQ